jgi:PAS domain S-box-containing protein
VEQQAHVDLSSLIDSTEDLLWSVDLDHRLLAFNRAFRKHIEVTYGVSAAVGMRLEDLLPPERAALLSPFLDSAITRGSFRAEYPLLSGRMLELSFNQIADGGVVSGTSIFGKDITDRKASEQALQEVDRKYRDIFDGAIEGLFQTNLEGQPLAANQAVANMLGYATVDEVISAIADSADHFWADPAAYAKFKNQLYIRA